MNQVEYTLEPLQQLAAGDPAFLSEIVQTVYDQFTTFRTALLEAQRKEDIGLVSRTAHALKSNARLLGMASIVPDTVFLAQFVEQGTSTTFSEVDARVARIIRTLEWVTEDLKEKWSVS